MWSQLQLVITNLGQYSQRQKPVRKEQLQYSFSVQPVEQYFSRVYASTGTNLNSWLICPGSRNIQLFLFSGYLLIPCVHVPRY